MKCDIGHFEITTGERCYNLVPSFENIMKLGTPAELVELYTSAHEIFNPSVVHSKREYMYAIGTAADVIRACSDIDPSEILIDVTRKDSGLKMVLTSKEQLTPETQLIIASGLLRHGVAGVSKKEQKGKGKAATEVDLWEFVHTAMAHLNMSKSEAMALTMTEFVRLFEAKYPPEDKPQTEISDDEYDEAIAMMNKNRIARGEKEWQPNQ